MPKYASPIIYSTGYSFINKSGVTANQIENYMNEKYEKKKKYVLMLKN